MARIPLVTRDAVAVSERDSYDEFAASRGGEPKVGPYTLLAHMPEMARRFEDLRTYIRADDSVSQKLQELVMITVAREMGCDFIWYAHAGEARKAGVRDDIIDNTRDRKELTGLDADETTVVNFARELLQSRRVSQATFDAASASLGQRGTMLLTNLIASYALLAYNMNTYELAAPVHLTEKGLPQ
jgi:4-carboxymuconolactone decarboxylase